MMKQTVLAVLLVAVCSLSTVKAGPAVDVMETRDSWTIECADNDACVEYTGAPDAVCSNDIAFSPDVVVKALSCEATDPSLQSFLVADSIEVLCEVDRPENSTDASTLSCTFGLEVADLLGGAQIMCTTEACTAEEGNLNVACPSVTCGCEPEDCGSPLVGPILSSITAAGMTCDAAGDCIIALTGLPIAGGNVAARCTSAACLVPSEM